MAAAEESSATPGESSVPIWRSSISRDAVRAWCRITPICRVPDLLEKLEIIRSQEEAIRSLSTPILQLREGIVVLPVIGLVNSMRAAQMLEDLLGTIVRTKARYAILDLTGVELMDTHAADHLLKVVRASSLVGARCLISGISANMAQTVVSLGVDLDGLVSFSTLEAALRFALTESVKPRRAKKRRRRA